MNESNQNTQQTAETDQTTVEAPKNSKLKNIVANSIGGVAIAVAAIGGLNAAEADSPKHVDETSQLAPTPQEVVPGSELAPKPMPTELVEAPNTFPQTQGAPESSSDNLEPKVEEPKMPSEPMVTPPAPEVTPTDTPTEFVSDGGPTEEPTGEPTEFVSDGGPTEQPTEFVSDGGPVEPKQ